MIEGHQKCLEALEGLTCSDGEMCVPFAPIERETGYDRRTVRRYIRALARKGFAEYFRGLCTKDGDFAGAGYCITRAGVSELYAQERTNFILCIAPQNNSTVF